MISKLLFLFNKKEKSQSFILIFLLFTTMIFELFGIAVLIPTVSLLIDVDYIDSSPYLNTINAYLSKYNIDIVLFFLILLVLIFIVKSIIQIYATFKQKKIASELNMNISNRLFMGYLNQPFLYYSEKNRSRIIHNLQTEMLHFFLFFESLLGLIAESLITTGMYLFILYVEPTGTIILSITFIIASIIYFTAFNKRLKRWGLIRISLDK